MTSDELLSRRGVTHAPVAAESFRLIPRGSEEAKRLDRTLRRYTFRVTGIERDRTPFDCEKQVRAQDPAQAQGLLEVSAVLSYGARIDSCVLVREEALDA
jgi:hypothetical protein